MPQVLRDVPDAHLIIFGEGELRERARTADQGAPPREARAARGLSRRRSQLVKSADLFVMSSVTEGLGSTVLDAMAMKLAVVGTNAGGIPEAVVHGETGLLVTPGHATELAQAIVRLLKDPAFAAGWARRVTHE